MCCYEKNAMLNSFICNVLFRIKHFFYLVGQYVIKPLKLKLLSIVRNFLDDVHCPLTGSYFRPCRPQLPVGDCICLGEVSLLIES